MSEAKTFNTTFKSISEILELVSECGSIEDLKDYTAELVSLGKDLDALYQETTTEITELKEKNKELEDENAKLKEENRKLKVYIKSMSAADYRISTAACEKEYGAYWELLEEESRKFLVTSYFILRKPKYPISYEQRLHDVLYKNKWNLKVFESKDFTEESIDYMEKYRNFAAHIHLVEEQFAIDCKIATKEMLMKLISAYPKSK